MPTIDAFLAELKSPSREQLAEHLERWLARGDDAAKQLARELTLAAFRGAFVEPRVFAPGEADRPGALQLAELDRRMQGLFALIFPNDGSDLEYALADSVLGLMKMERTWPAQRERWTKIAAALMTVPHVYARMLSGSELEGLRGLLRLIGHWVYARATYTPTFAGWVSLSRQKHPELDVLAELWLARPA